MPTPPNRGLGCPSRTTTRPTLLAVTSRTDDAAPLRAILDSGRWLIENASNCREAVRAARRLRPRVVLCEESLPDGTWRDLLRELDDLCRGSRLIVVSRNADDALWAEVLNLGGYDVLSQPLDGIELQRAVENCYPGWPPNRGALTADSPDPAETEMCAA